MQGTSSDLPAGEKKCQPVNKDHLSIMRDIVLTASMPDNNSSSYCRDRME